MERPHGQLRVLFVYQDADLDLAGGDDFDVDVFARQRFEHGFLVMGCDASMGAHADANDADLGDFMVGLDGGLATQSSTTTSWVSHVVFSGSVSRLSAMITW